MASKKDEPIYVHPGDTVPVSGIWQEVGPRGGSPGDERTMVKGKVVPPSREAGRKFVLVRASKGS